MAIESSAGCVSVALARDGAVVFEEEVPAGRRPSEVLLAPLREALAQRVGGKLALIVVGTGPGSYNGARVGIAAAQGIALVDGATVVGLPSLEALGTVRRGGRCLALGDARRGTFFTLELEGGKQSGEPKLIEHAVFVQAVAGASSSGTALVTVEEPTRLKLPVELADQVELALPQARLLLESWWARSEAEREALVAIPPETFYLRPPHITKAKAKSGSETGSGRR